LFLDITGLFGVPIAGIFALGIFTKRANTPGIWVGLFVAAVTAYFVQPTDLTPFAISTVAFFTSFIVGYLASFLFPNWDKGRNIEGLTIHTKDKEYIKQS
ncbi:MAG TPA: Na+/proline symporter, partial [Pseudogracilibacillus sp.]|nr:Na+/proline symporter [Pseudogracilibacillus sp.]